MEINKISTYCTSYEIVVSIEHKETIYTYMVKYVVLAQGSHYIEYIRKCHTERLTTSEKKQIKSLIANHINKITN